MWLSPVIALGSFTGVVLATPDTSGDIPAALLSYGGVGILALVGLYAMRIVVRSGDRERAELLARAQRAEAAFTDLNTVIQRDVLEALRESQRTVGDALGEIRHLRG